MTRGALPTFLIVGAQKAGTSTLARLLARHPDVGMPTRKELHFFATDQRYRKGTAWYANRWARFADLPARFEATPEYLYVPAAAPRMAADLSDDTRFVVILRDPVARAYSQYWHARRIGAIRGTFEAALAREPAELAAGRFGWASLVDRGRYCEQLDRFAAAVGRERMLVLRFDDLVADPTGTADEVARFVGVAPLGAAWGPLPHANPARRAIVPLPHVAYRSMPFRLRVGVNRVLTRPLVPPPMRPETRAHLISVLGPENEALADRWGVDVGSWSR